LKRVLKRAQYLCKWAKSRSLRPISEEIRVVQSMSSLPRREQSLLLTWLASKSRTMRFAIHHIELHVILGSIPQRREEIPLELSNESILSNSSIKCSISSWPNISAASRRSNRPLQITTNSKAIDDLLAPLFRLLSLSDRCLCEFEHKEEMNLAESSFRFKPTGAVFK
jgi:hypothetical protein